MANQLINSMEENNVKNVHAYSPEFLNDRGLKKKKQPKIIVWSNPLLYLPCCIGTSCFDVHQNDVNSTSKLKLRCLERHDKHNPKSCKTE